MNRYFHKAFFALLLTFSTAFAAFPTIGYAQSSPQTATATDYATALQTIENKAEARRKELGIPGISLVIVKDDKVIYAKGLGYKDFENKVPVTPDTQFAIGSATKAFTALSVLMAMDERKLALEDSPKKYLPYFKMYDPDTDKNIQIRDLLSHASGLNRTDLAMVTGKLNRKELIQVAAQAKPTAKLREKFQYQNIMFAAAGEIASVVENKPYNDLITDRIFKPLGMKNSSMSLKDMQQFKDYSYGYTYNFDTKETEKQPFRDIDEVAPAGSINSTARDMGEWLRFVLNGGTVNGKRLVSEKGYDEWLKPQMKVGGGMDYGFGWFLQKWNGLKVVQHGGNIDGFNSMVAMIPEKHIGFVLLTNVSASSMGTDMMPVVWSNLIEGQNTETTKLPLKTMQLLAGKYGPVEVKIEGEDLFLVVPGQPPYKLERTAPRTFKALGLPDGFGAKFTPETGDATELEMIQPQGNKKLPRIVDGAAPKTEAANSAAAKELVGTYVTPQGNVDVREADGKITFNISGQQPYTLIERSKDTYSLSPLPEDQFSLKTKRDDAGKVISLVVTQPQGVFEFKKAGADSSVKISVDELAAKTIEAVGGEANWRKLTSRVVDFEMDLENQGVQAHGTQYAKAPNKTASETTFTAIGKTIADEWEYFDGTKGADKVSFAPVDEYSGKRLDDIRIGSDFYEPLDWKTNYKSVSINGIAKVGDEDAYTVVFQPEKGTAFTEYYSTKTFLLLKREGVISSSTSEQQIPYSVLYSDYRDVDGVKLAFKTVNSNIANGSIVTTLKTVKHNTPLDDKLFGPKK